MTSNVQSIVEVRIEKARRYSPIIVEVSTEGEHEFEAYFGDTIHGYEMLENPTPEYIGCFYGPDGVDDFRKAIWEKQQCA